MFITSKLNFFVWIKDLCVKKIFLLSGKVFNYKINVDNDLLYISSKNKFSSLVKLIEFYEENTSGFYISQNYAKFELFIVKV